MRCLQKQLILTLAFTAALVSSSSDWKKCHDCNQVTKDKCNKHYIEEIANTLKPNTRLILLKCKKCTWVYKNGITRDPNDPSANDKSARTKFSATSIKKARANSVPTKDKIEMYDEITCLKCESNDGNTPQKTLTTQTVIQRVVLQCHNNTCSTESKGLVLKYKKKSGKRKHTEAKEMFGDDNVEKALKLLTDPQANKTKSYVYFNKKLCVECQKKSTVPTRNTKTVTLMCNVEECNNRSSKIKNFTPTRTVGKEKLQKAEAMFGSEACKNAKDAFDQTNERHFTFNQECLACAKALTEKKGLNKVVTIQCPMPTNGFEICAKQEKITTSKGRKAAKKKFDNKYVEEARKALDQYANVLEENLKKEDQGMKVFYAVCNACAKSYNRWKANNKDSDPKDHTKFENVKKILATQAANILREAKKQGVEEKNFSEGRHMVWGKGAWCFKSTRRRLIEESKTRFLSAQELLDVRVRRRDSPVMIRLLEDIIAARR